MSSTSYDQGHAPEAPARGLVPRPEELPRMYLTLADLADRAGITLNSARTYHKRANAHRAAGNPRPGDLPEPDLHLGGIPGWEEQTITTWLASRPRKPIYV